MPCKCVAIKESRYVQSYLYQNSLHIGTLWAGLSLAFQKREGLCGSAGDIEINMSLKNWRLYEEVVDSAGFRLYMNYIKTPKPKKKKRR